MMKNPTPPPLRGVLMVIGRYMQVCLWRGMVLWKWWQHTTFKMTTDYGILNKKRANIYIGQNKRDKYIVNKDRWGQILALIICVSSKTSN